MVGRLSDVGWDPLAGGSGVVSVSDVWFVGGGSSVGVHSRKVAGGG